MSEQINNSHKWWILTASAMMVLLLNVDATAVALILAPLSVQLHVPLATLQWIMNAYLLIYAACIVAGGRLGDIFGQRYILMTGVIIFIIASIIAVFAPNVETILVARLIQGVGAAIISPNAMAIIYRAFPAEQKGIATGVITSVMGGGIALGPFIGGLLATLYSWRLVFFINIPFGIIALVLIFMFVKYRQLQTKNILRKLDITGLILFGSMLFCLVATIDNIDNLPARLLLFICLLIATIILFVLFCVTEKRAANPLIKTELLKNKIISYGCVIRLLFALPIVTLIFIIALYLQRALGYSPLHAGLMFIPVTLMMVTLAPFAGKLVDKRGHMLPFMIGIIAFLIALIGFIFIGHHVSVYVLLALFALIGVGLGFGRPALVTAVMKVVPEAQLGVVSSTFNMMNSLGGPLGLAFSGVILGYYAHLSPKNALFAAIPIIMWMCIGVLLLIIALLFIGLRPEPTKN